MSDRRLQLAQQLFGLPDGPAEGEAQIAMAERIGEVILRDLISHATTAWNDCGPGVLVVRRVSDDARWSPAAMLQQNLETARRENDTAMAEAFSSTLEAIGKLNIDERVPIAIADHRGWRLLLLPVDQPEAGLKDLLGNWKA